ncbi:hypothetical protein ACFLUT_02320 [Chloroflexota bacterium]
MIRIGGGDVMQQKRERCRSVTRDTDTLVAEYIESLPESQKLNEQAARLFAGNGATHSARVMNPFRPYNTHAKGSLKRDVDGNEYTDFVMGHGTVILGRNHPVISIQRLQH